MVETRSLDFQQVYDDIIAFVHWLANQKAIPNVFLMDPEELAADLAEEMWKVFLAYQDKLDDKDKMLAVIRTSLDNRMSELLYKYTLTHRKDGNYALSLDGNGLDGEDEDDESADYLEGSIMVNIGATISMQVDSLLESQERVEETRRRLSPEAREVFDAVIYGSPLVAAQVKLSGIRASHVYKGTGTIRVKEFHVANALGISEKDVRIHFAEISQVYAEVCAQ